jgi:3-oxoacyl-[acyl-carrier-protein] synthase-3
MSVSFDRNGSWPEKPALRLVRSDLPRAGLTRSLGFEASRTVRAAVAGTGSYVPSKVLSNADLAKQLDTSDDWIVDRTGIRERRIAGDEECTSTMAAEAGRRACQDAGIDPADLDLVIVATLTPDYLLPATACIVQHAIGARRAGGFDLEAACSGFVFASNVAQSLILTGMCENILVIGAETLSRFVDYQDRSTCILFGDGAGAAVYTARRDGTGIQYTSMYADGSQAELLYIPCGGSRIPPRQEALDQRLHFVRVAGRQIAKFATTILIELVEKTLAECGMTKDELSLLIPHQVNERIIDSALRRLDLPREKCFVNIDQYGNTSAASVPIALDEARRQGRLNPGDTAMLVGFGAGLTWGATVLKM